MLEKTLQSECLDYIKQYRDIVCANIHGGGWANKGFPDLVACIKGKYVAFELKVGSNKMENAQRLWKKRIEQAGGLHFEIRTIDEFKKTIEDIINDKK